MVKYIICLGEIQGLGNMVQACKPGSVPAPPFTGMSKFHGGLRRILVKLNPAKLTMHS